MISNEINFKRIKMKEKKQINLSFNFSRVKYKYLFLISFVITSVGGKVNFSIKCALPLAYNFIVLWVETPMDSKTGLSPFPYHPHVKH